ncbi:MAG: hypothetical protein ACOYN0_18765, partial [Phycisphaerales bacterium]
ALEFGKTQTTEGDRPLTALVCCTPVDQPEHADQLLVLKTGPEVLTGSTRMKAGTATKLTLNIISTTLMIRMGKVYENLMVDVKASNAKLRDRAARIIGTLTGLEREGCFELLDRAGGVVKTAVVMERLGLGRSAAEAKLAEVAGRLHDALGDQAGSGGSGPADREEDGADEEPGIDPED